jgi:hypothetical protein
MQQRQPELTPFAQQKVYRDFRRNTVHQIYDNKDAR